jgi:transposase
MYGKDFSFSSTRQEFEVFCHWMKSLMIEHEKTQVIVGMEPTGHYFGNTSEADTTRKLMD